jgi:flavodoxin
MKSLVAFYSLTGNTRLIAQTIAGAVNADMQEIRPIKGIPSRGFGRFLQGGRQAMLGIRTDLKPMERSAGDYDLVFLGTPVWAWRCAPPVRSFLATSVLRGKAVALFCCHGGSPGRTLSTMRAALTNSRVVGEIAFRDPAWRDTDDARSRAGDWAKYMARLAATPADTAK